LTGWTIAWDLDGTLVDTAPDLVRALNAVLAEEGHPPADFADARNFVGHGARALIERSAAHLKIAWDEIQLTDMTERFVAHYQDDIASRSRPFPGVHDALYALSGDGARHAVCTNKRTGLSVQLLETLNMDGWFEAIVGADSVSARKPDAAHLIETIAAAGGDLSRAILVGDSLTDANTALAARTPFVLVGFGYPGMPLADIPRDVLAASAGEIVSACRSIAAARE
jgi:phosphoglycolate phosphatase